MVKPEWGIKRTCNSCGAKFYDLQRDPIICPKCDAKVDPVAISRSQRSKAPVAVAKAAPKPRPVAVDDAEGDLVVDGDQVLALVDDDDDDDDEAAIEDVSELGEDHDDILNVKVKDESEESL